MVEDDRRGIQYPTEAGKCQTSNAKPLTGKFISSGIILKLKRNADGISARFKERLVGRGNFQPEEDFDRVEFYAPVTCIETVRILI